MKPDSLRGKYLEAMGIEVWYSKPVVQNTAARNAVTVSETAEMSPADAISSFNIHMVRYPGCLMIFDLAEPVATLASEHQRLLNDLALSIGIATAQTQLFREDWSRLSSGDPSKVIRERVGQLIGDSNTCLVVMGEVARRLLFGEQTGAMKATSFLGRSAIAVMGLETLLKDPISKRSLWPIMQKLGLGK